VAETAGSVQFGLTLGPLDGALQPPAEETLQRVERGEQRQEGGREGGWEGGSDAMCNGAKVKKCEKMESAV